MSTDDSRDGYDDVVVPVRRIYGASGAGPIEVSAADGMVHVRLGEQGAYLDRRAAEYLVRAIGEALELAS